MYVGEQKGEIDELYIGVCMDLMDVQDAVYG